MLLYFLLFAALCQLCLLPELKRRFANNKKHEFEQELYKFQLRTVRKHYPELKELNYSDIDQLYRVREAYFRIR